MDENQFTQFVEKSLTKTVIQKQRGLQRDHIRQQFEGENKVNIPY